MSKLDPTGESLESILASIRRSLSEQATDILADDAAPTPVALDTLGAVVPGEDAPPRFLGNGGPGNAGLANGGLQAPDQPQVPPPAETPRPAERPFSADRAFAGLDDAPPPASISATLARLTEESAPTAPMAVPAAVATPPQPEEAPKEPLWFLARGRDKGNGVPAPTPSGAPQATAPASAPPASPASAAPPPAAPPKPVMKEPVMKEMVRGPLPPFFGSSPEAAKVEVEVAPAPPLPGPLPSPAVIPPAPMPAAPMPPAPVTGPSVAEPPRAIAPDSTPRAPVVPAGSVGLGAPAGLAGAATREGLPNGKTHSVPVRPAAESAPPPPAASPPATSPPQLQGLDAMVADLLRPMLRRWLDENMPRLVSAALKAEAETVPKRDPKKP